MVDILELIDDEKEAIIKYTEFLKQNLSKGLKSKVKFIRSQEQNHLKALRKYLK